MSARERLAKIKERTEMIEGLVRGLTVVGSEQNIENMRGIANLLRYNLLDLDAALSAPAADAGTGETTVKPRSRRADGIAWFALTVSQRYAIADKVGAPKQEMIQTNTQWAIEVFRDFYGPTFIKALDDAAMSRAADRSQDGGGGG